jgi:hypothetical protein
MANWVADRGDVGNLPQAAVDKSLAANLRDEERLKTNMGCFLNAGKKADADRVVESRTMKTRLGVM